ncbi:MAG: hypothetical protein OXC81_03180 [Betaproteobacteria bacterium]|nr:hypothetical protein [Betaproteobacteria bacterium]
MNDERQIIADLFAQRKVAQQVSRQGERYVALLDDRFNVIYERDPYAAAAEARLIFELGMLPVDEGRQVRATVQMLEWNHYCLRRNSFGLVFSEEGARVQLVRTVTRRQIDEQDGTANLRAFLNAGRQASLVLAEAKAAASSPLGLGI